jgi:solute carrier family 20 (sodium-dependent phosphate transporter)
VCTEGKVSSSVAAPIWATFIGASGFVIGPATYGYTMTRALGVRLSKLTATHGFCVELSAALIIMIASQLGLPTSSSQCITGGTIDAGLSEGRTGAKWKLCMVQFSSWITTLFIMGLCTAGLFAQGVYAPSIPTGAQLIYCEDSVAAVTQVWKNCDECPSLPDDGIQTQMT